MKKRVSIWFLIAALTCVAGAHELRVWEDIDGNQFEGRFLRELFGKLTIEAEDGTRKVFELEELSDLDQKYLRVMVPPELEAEVRTQSTLIPPRKQFFKRDETTEDHVVSATITKKSQRPFTSRLNAELFLVGEEVEGDNHILLSRTEGSFLLPTARNSEVEFKSRTTRTIKFRDVVSDEFKGELYQGYLLLINSLQGDVLLIDSNLPSWMQKPAVVENLRELSIRGTASVRSRHFDAFGNKVSPPRSRYAAPRAK